jgi:hypothetical protein
VKLKIFNHDRKYSLQRLLLVSCCFRRIGFGYKVVSAIHNDSFTNGRLAVFAANTPADTVVFRQTAPFTNLIVKDKEPNKIEKPKTLKAKSAKGYFSL